MNQILNQKEENLEKQQYPIHLKKKSKFLFIFLFSILFLFILLIYIFYHNYQILQKNNFSKKMADRFEISKLYNSNIMTKNSSSVLEYSENDDNFDIIGMIKIEKLNINYPILSNYSNNLLKIAPCRISGPLPNETGNLCIAAHNYNNSTFFSDISLLEKNDLITIFDSSGNFNNYFIYQNYEVDYNDLSCISPTDYREITLITCNNLNPNKRIIVKAKERL